MNKAVYNEAVTITGQIAVLLTNTLHGQVGAAGAELQTLCGALIVNAGLEIVAGTLGDDLLNCFEQARVAGAAFADFENIRIWASNQTPEGIPAIAIVNAAIRLALTEESEVLAAITFTSRQDINNYLVLMNASFDAAELYAADSLDNVAYQAIIACHGAVNADLNTRARPLPRMVTYNFAKRMPSLWLAQRLYADGSRSDELVAENSVINPNFCPQSGMCLSQ
jgi:hypothetical protein